VPQTHNNKLTCEQYTEKQIICHITTEIYLLEESNTQYAQKLDNHSMKCGLIYFFKNKPRLVCQIWNGTQIKVGSVQYIIIVIILICNS